jgi:thiol-disulfide isomerase/thioredoxin
MNLLTYIEKGISYENYLVKVQEQMNQMKEEGDPKGYVQYYSLGITRMERWNKIFQLSDEQKSKLKLKTISTNFQLLTISEGWCGDASQILPIAEVIMNELGVSHRIVFRDENPELMDEFLTDGARSIPILIGVDKDGKEIFRFGPRPAYGMDLLLKHKENPEEYSANEFHKELQQFYNQDKGEAIFNELIEKIQN